MAKISDKDYEIMDFIYYQLKEKGFPPSVREICEAVGLTSTASIHARLKKLEEAGFIVKDASKNRSMRLVNYAPKDEKIIDINVNSDDKYMEIPIYGKVTAGIPITAIQQHIDNFPLPMHFAKNKELFMLTVSGESMINAAILDGDLIIVQQQPTASNGDIVVALVNDNEATVKTFYKENGHFRLQPENDYMDPIIVDEVTILGKVVGVFRQM